MADLQASDRAPLGAPDDLDVDDAEATALCTEAIDLLDRGEARVAESAPDGSVVVHEWLKQAILLLFRQSEMATIELGPFEYADKIPLKRDFQAAGVRVVPGASARFGSFLDRGVVMMPSYVNIGARVGANTMVDTWATVGSCAQIGDNVHLRAAWASAGCSSRRRRRPVIIEDDCLIGSRCIVAEGPGSARARCSARAASSTGLDPGHRRRDRRGALPRRRAAVVGGRVGHPAPDVPRRRVRPAVRAGHQAPEPRASATTRRSSTTSCATTAPATVTPS